MCEEWAEAFAKCVSKLWPAHGLRHRSGEVAKRPAGIVPDSRELERKHRLAGRNLAREGVGNLQFAIRPRRDPVDVLEDGVTQDVAADNPKARGRIGKCGLFHHPAEASRVLAIDRVDNPVLRHISICHRFDRDKAAT